MRYKEFNSNRVLEKCINLFWNKGYTASSINDVVKTTGVNRFSLYNEFENKDGIMFATLQLYKERYLSKKLVSKKSKNATEEIFGLFNNYLMDEEKHPPGCYIIHIATEVADTDEQVKSILEDYTNELENKLIEILNQYPNTISESKFYAKHLLGLFCSCMCFSVIQSYNERTALVSAGIKVILNKKTSYATND